MKMVRDRRVRVKLSDTKSSKDSVKYKDDQATYASFTEACQHLLPYADVKAQSLQNTEQAKYLDRIKAIAAAFHDNPEARSKLHQIIRDMCIHLDSSKIEPGTIKALLIGCNHLPPCDPCCVGSILQRPGTTQCQSTVIMAEHNPRTKRINFNFMNDVTPATNPTKVTFVPNICQMSREDKKYLHEMGVHNIEYEDSNGHLHVHSVDQLPERPDDPSPKGSDNNWIIWLILLALAILVIYLLVRNRRPRYY